MRQTAEERFWAKVDQSGECWLWTGCKDDQGYGTFGVEKHTVRAHRFAWTLTHGPIPNGVDVCHSCDNPSCVRVDHLFLGTQQDNSDDMKRKRRQPHGIRHGMAVLTDSDVIAIRQRYAAGGVTLTQLGREYGVVHSAISAIVTRRRWRHLP